MNPMQTTGKILFYNPNDGTGLIMAEDKMKYSFEINQWDDYNALPAAGQKVCFDVEEHTAICIVMSDVTLEPSDGEAESLKEEPSEHVTPTTIRLNVVPEQAINEYFTSIDREIQERTRYQAATGRLDFLRIRRFLFTTYNNLTELDVHFITPELKTMRDDLLQMSRVYDDYKTKTTYPDVAFEKVFLSRQMDYVQLKDEVGHCLAELKRLRVLEQMLSEQAEEKEEVLNRSLRGSSQFARHEEEYKELKKNLVDTIHAMASFNERYKAAMHLMSDFEKEHREEFVARFSKASRKYRKQILFILDAQAFMFDAILWRQAKQSKVIKRFFEEARIEGEYCAKTYLKYYLNTLDPEIISAEQQGLFELYEYLESLERDAVVAVVSDVDDALRIKYALAPTGFVVETFVDERKALAWMLDRQPSLLIIEDTLPNLSFERFVNTCQKRVSCHLSMVIMSNLSSEKFPIEGLVKVLRKGASDKELRDIVETILKKDDDG